jgi:hypothetical protein
MIPPWPFADKLDAIRTQTHRTDRRTMLCHQIGPELGQSRQVQPVSRSDRFMSQYSKHLDGSAKQ